MSGKAQLSKQVKDAFDNYSREYLDIELISLSTTDGFPVHNFSRDIEGFEKDKMAAAASTLYSVSNAVAQQILSKHFNVTFIETDDGNVAFVTLTMSDKDYVLAMSGGKGMSIATLRLLLNRLAGEVSTLPLYEAA